MTCVSLCYTEQDQKMNSYLFFLVIAVSSLTVSPQLQTCPTDHFSAIFAGTVDKVSSGIRGFGNTDPELKFLKEILGFRDDAIQHSTEDAMKFFFKKKEKVRSQFLSIST